MLPPSAYIKHYKLFLFERVKDIFLMQERFLCVDICQLASFYFVIHVYVCACLNMTEMEMKLCLQAL